MHTAIYLLAMAVMRFKNSVIQVGNDDIYHRLVWYVLAVVKAAVVKPMLVKALNLVSMIKKACHVLCSIAQERGILSIILVEAVV